MSNTLSLTNTSTGSWCSAYAKSRSKSNSSPLSLTVTLTPTVTQSKTIVKVSPGVTVRVTPSLTLTLTRQFLHSATIAVTINKLLICLFWLLLVCYHKSGNSLTQPLDRACHLKVLFLFTSKTGVTRFLIAWTRYHTRYISHFVGERCWGCFVSLSLPCYEFKV